MADRMDTEGTEPDRPAWTFERVMWASALYFTLLALPGIWLTGWFVNWQLTTPTSLANEIIKRQFQR